MRPERTSSRRHRAIAASPRRRRVPARLSPPVNRDDTDAMLIARYAHPVRVWIVEAMRWIGRPLSASELDHVLTGVGLAPLTYHMRVLDRFDIAKPVAGQKMWSASKRPYVLND